MSTVTVSGMKKAFEKLPNCYYWVHFQENGVATEYKVAAPSSVFMAGPQYDLVEYVFRPVKILFNGQINYEWQLVGY